MERRLRSLRNDHNVDDRQARDRDQKAFGRPVRLWLTELGYQSNPPDRTAGVPPAVPGVPTSQLPPTAPGPTSRVDLLIQYLYRDEPSTDRWQSGLETIAGRAKPARAAVVAPLAEVTRRGSTTALWGVIRPGSGHRPYRLQRWTGGHWTTMGGVQRTAAGGMLRRSVQASAGTKLRLLAGTMAGNTLVVR